MEPEPFALVIVFPLLMALGLLCLVRRYRQKFEQEKKQVQQIICDKQLNEQQGEITAKFNDIK